ncbi:MAG TPA: outer membrane beta-barrel protein [Bryobacteraceae bacterium]
MNRWLPVILAVLPGALWAQSGELWVSAGASLLANTDLGSATPAGNSNDVHLGDAGFRIGLRLTLNTSGRWGHEFQYGYTYSYFNDRTGGILGSPGSTGMGMNQLGYNVLYYFNATNTEPKVRPFVTAGVQADDYVMPFSAVVNHDNNSWRPGFNYGGGMQFRLSQLFAWRFDVRGYDTGKPNWAGIFYKQGGILHQTEASVSFGFVF